MKRNKIVFYYPIAANYFLTIPYCFLFLEKNLKNLEVWFGTNNKPDLNNFMIGIKRIEK